MNVRALKEQLPSFRPPPVPVEDDPDVESDSEDKGGRDRQLPQAAAAHGRLRVGGSEEEGRRPLRLMVSTWNVLRYLDLHAYSSIRDPKLLGIGGRYSVLGIGH